MCGICGFAYTDPSRPVEPERLNAMRSAISHRGPDGQGVRIGHGVALGHCRLSIIDLAGGAQPLANEDGTVWVTFNGEIYNFPELTEELVRRGHRFETRCDTEVLVHAYEEYGLDFPKYLNGMFALAIHDTRRGRVVLVRDHLGIKPLFYSVTPEGLFFASEIKAVLAGSGRDIAVDSDGLAEYMIFRYVTGSRTFFDGVRRLPPGSSAVWENGSLQIASFWSPDGVALRNDRSDDVVDELRSQFDRSVRAQMMSDVPLGAFCSGGVDSGLVTASASGQTFHQLNTFSVGFRDPAWDESDLARDTAARFSTDHRTLIAEPAEFQELLPKLLWFNDEPLSHPNSVPLYLLSKFAREHVTVILTGEGADELFAGYPRYHIAKLAYLADMAPAGARRQLARFARSLPGHRAARVGALLPLDYYESLLLNSAYVPPELVTRLLGRPAMECLDERRALLQAAAVPGDPVATMSRYEMSTYLGCALDRMDRMSMANGLEARVPFLDLPLVEWGLGLRSSAKIRGRTNKYVVREAAEGILSPRITRGRKSGFGIPLGDWFRGAAFRGIVNRLRNPDHPAAEHFDRDVVGQILEEHAAEKRDHGEVLWHLANVYLWHDVHLSGEADPNAAEEREAGVPSRG